MGASAPASANSVVQVVPVSATSGVVLPAMEVTNRSCASAHWTNCTSSVAPVSFLNSSPTSLKKAVESGLVPCMIHTLSFWPFASTEPPSPLPPLEQAVRASAAIVTAATER